MYHSKEQIKELLADLESTVDKSTDEYFNKYMKIVYSFGKEMRLTQKGIERCEELYQKWLKGEVLEREDLLILGFLLSDVSVLEQNKTKIHDLVTIYNQTIIAYNPDFDYMNQFVNTVLPAKGYSEVNKEYIPEIEEMYLRDFVITDKEQIEMLSTRQMPISDLKVCPYCKEDFSNAGIEALFKHVKDTHGKK